MDEAGGRRSLGSSEWGGEEYLVTFMVGCIKDGGGTETGGGYVVISVANSGGGRREEGCLYCVRSCKSTLEHTPPLIHT